MILAVYCFYFLHTIICGSFLKLDTIKAMKRFRKFIGRLSKKQKAVLAVVSILLFSLIAYVVFGLLSKEKEPETPPKPVYSQLMGIEVDPNVAKRPVLGVMIENHPDARPQSGLSDAGIVFEAVAEGGITRYLALYQENQPDNLGPIRSLRAYYLDWAMGLDAAIAHVGGSADALSLVDSRNAKSLSQLAHPDPYQRVGTKQAPHNVYSSVNSLRGLMNELGFVDSSKFNEFPRSLESPAQTPNATKININFSFGEYAVEYRYNTEANNYTRYLAGAPDIDANTSKPIVVKNVVVLKLAGPISNAIGNGQALIYKDGTVASGTWRQSSFRDRVTLADTEGNEIPLNRGNTWFAALPNAGSVEHR